MRVRYAIGRRIRRGRQHRASGGEPGQRGMAVLTTCARGGTATCGNERDVRSPRPCTRPPGSWRSAARQHVRVYRIGRPASARGQETFVSASHSRPTAGGSRPATPAVHVGVGNQGGRVFQTLQTPRRYAARVRRGGGGLLTAGAAARCGGTWRSQGTLRQNRASNQQALAVSFGPAAVASCARRRDRSTASSGAVATLPRASGSRGRVRRDDGVVFAGDWRGRVPLRRDEAADRDVPLQPRTRVFHPPRPCVR